ncbi:Indolepyruvate ferredoxin oxidoreductase, alpha and beta subunits [Pseudomonas sp. OF001]|uniref:indolepyruvate ferredoxin oxidoreductase family protein n=1 Tax=Pseudomonas sp. OF001 TaxID=2772300 RepID=UPI0019186FE0|nr:indolepyruvate ferredoxin oxidoreductase family protein [Pseudomonas sp. OF001]CAD5377806.1 Indolepyruvate ferredoxin oxidoreductase, alpha and beta subunits [Pseudomonas sp. OF001]
MTHATERASTVQLRSDYRLSDSLEATSGQIFLTGTQALVRLPLMQRALDRARGLNSAGFISGYRGSPLGMVDQALWKAKRLLADNQIEFLPAINEELGGTAVLGTQQVESDPARTVDGVFAYWYGKGPGVDRAGDALKHGHAYGSSPNGGVLIVAGDDHGCVSSSMPHQSDLAFQAWSVPTVSPATIAEYLEFGLYGWALSRFSGAWVGFTALSEVVESGSTVDLDRIQTRFDAPVDYTPPTGGLHYRWPDLPSLQLEARQADKLDAVRAFAKSNSIDKTIVACEQARFGIVTCGKAHLDFLECLRRLDISLDDLARAGIRVYKIGLSFPIEPNRALDFVKGLEEVLVIEEKAPVIERQLRELLYNQPSELRPRLLGKQDAAGKPLLSALGELRPSRIMPVLADWLARQTAGLDRRHLVRDFTAPSQLSNLADAVRRSPYFCSGCPHNSSTKVPEGSRALAGIGCHFMANWMDRETSGLIQMGGEGVDWAAHSRFTQVPHVFQNLGDGTYYHSGYLAIRQSIAAKANITYKILFNDAVAMTGGQPVDGTITVDAIAQQVTAEGARKVVVLSDDIAKYAAVRDRFPASTAFHPREDLDKVQRELRETSGVTVLIYEQTCAAEKRRRRKKGEFPDPDRRLFINQAVCEGCGDCGVASNCLSLVPLETELGRKRQLDQSSCNKDYSCVNGFCPSFVSVKGGRVRKGVGALQAEAGQRALAELLNNLPRPAAHVWNAPYDLLVTGVGGTGVVTVGALISMAAHLEFKSASVLDFMGFAQKGGAVLSFVRLADVPERLNQVRIDTQQADALLACDLVVAASSDALQSVKHGRTKVIANRHVLPTAEFVQNPDANLQTEGLLEKIRHAVGEAGLELCDAQSLAQRALGDSIGANILLMGYAWQAGLIPLSLESLQRAIELNGVAVPMNLAAFGLGRLARANPQGLRQLLSRSAEVEEFRLIEDFDELVAHRELLLTDYQNAAYARRFRQLVDEVASAERALLGKDAKLRLSPVVARGYAKLMAYKDEYEVARLYSDPAFRQQLEAQFEGDFRLEFHMAPPLLSRPGADGRARKITIGPWLAKVFPLLAKAKGLRGSALDLFGKTEERRMERRLIEEYAARIRELLPQLKADNLDAAVRIAALAEEIRGYGHVKLASVERVRTREAQLLHAFAPQRYAKPQAPKAAAVEAVPVQVVHIQPARAEQNPA